MPNTDDLPAVPGDSGDAAPRDLRRDMARRMIQIGITMLVTALILFGVAGTWRWPEAWLLVGLTAVGTLAAELASTRCHPEVIAARSHMWRSEAPRWDRAIVVAYALAWAAVLVLAGLEYRWRGLSGLPLALPLLGAVGFLLAYALIGWSMACNPFFETLVRIQHERGHVTVTSGPYAYVRHPGYVGIVLFLLSTPPVLRSPWAVAPALLGGTVLVVRTALEDRFLQANLAGYADYARRVRYRLVPGLW